MDLFPFIDTMFAKPAEFDKIRMYERGKHFFMINRFSSIKYPVQASYFNHIKIHPGQAVSFWKDNLGKMYNRTPKWMYVKTKKAKEEKKKLVISEEALRKYCEIHKVSRRDLEEGIVLLGEEFEKELKQFESLL